MRMVMNSKMGIRFLYVNDVENTNKVSIVMKFIANLFLYLNSSTGFIQVFITSYLRRCNI